MQAFGHDGDLFSTFTLHAPIHYNITANEVTICMEPENLDTFKQTLESRATIEAFDGVKRETAKTFVLDKKMKV
jgi:hypothetical protein